MNDRGWTRDPSAPSLAVFALVALGGFVMIGLGWRIAARTLFVPFQVPAILSGGLGGLALVMIGAGLLNAQATRRIAASERAETEALLDVIAAARDALDRNRP